MRSFNEDVVRFFVLLYLDNQGMPLRITSFYVQRGILIGAPKN